LRRPGSPNIPETTDRTAPADDLLQHT
jgi:hypothetical protein